MSEWVAYALPDGKSGYRVVVAGLTHFNVDRIEDVQEAARKAILNRLHLYLPPQRLLATVPETVWTGEFEVEVRVVVRT